MLMKTFFKCLAVLVVAIILGIGSAMVVLKSPIATI